MAGLEAALGLQAEGTLSSWKPPWGWLNCPELGFDVFAHEEDLVSGVLSKGARVSFEVGKDPRSGRPRALQMQAGIGAADGVSAARFGKVDSLGQRVEGVVAHWKEPWGWFTCAQEEKDVFAHREDILVEPGMDPFAPVEAGTAVTFAIGIDQKTGRRRALQIQLLSQEPRFHGVVTSWRDQWGWISCPDFPDGDIFAHKEDLPAGSFVETGTPVCFEVGSDQKGRRRAMRITSSVGSKGKGSSKAGGMVAGGALRPAIGAGTGSYVKGAPKGGMVPVYWIPADGFTQGGKGKAAVATNGPADFLGQRTEGVVISWKEQWGWVSIPNAGDVFAHSEDIVGGPGELPVGAHIVFTVGQDAKGRMRAKQIQLRGSGAGFGALKRKKGAEIASGAGGDSKGFESVEGQLLQGEVTSWKSPWGWTRVSGFSGDVFTHKDDVDTGEELQVGQSIAFVIGRDPKTKRWRAMQIMTEAEPKRPRIF